MGYQIFYGMGLYSRVLGMQELDAMNVTEHTLLTSWRSF